MDSSIDISTSEKGKSLPVSERVSRKRWPKSLVESRRSVSKPKIFRIDTSLPIQSLNPASLSTRARNVLKSIGVNDFRDLDGVSHEVILESKNCGLKTYKEIALYAEWLQPGSKKTPALESQPSPGESLISIPSEAQSWSLHQLPLSLRLQHVLKRLNLRVLGDLQATSYSALAEMPDCGARTIRELQEFVDRIHRNEFGTAQKQAETSSAAFLVSRIDAFLESVDPRWASIFVDRVGARGEPMTLMRVGQKYNLTRERVRQMVDLLTEKTLLFGGPPFAEALQSLTNELNQKLWPFTPALLQDLVQSHVQPRYTWSFYIRLLGWLSPDISAWPTGQTPAAYRRTEQERVIQQMKLWFKGKSSSVPFQDVYAQLNAGDSRCAPFEFLEAARFAAEFAIDLQNPREPRISPPVETPRRWAQDILSATDLSVIPTEALARARALCHARRSPGSKYRLARGSQR